MSELARFRNPVTPKQLQRMLTEDWTPSTEALQIPADLSPVLEAVGSSATGTGSLAPNSDAVIAPVLHKALKDLPRRDLLDMRFWHWMTTGPFRAYTVGRWSGGYLPQSEEGLPPGLQMRFLGTPSMVGYARNAVARLFWVAETLNAGGSYALTTRAFGNQDLIAGLFERRMSLVPVVARACVEELAEASETDRRDALIRLNLRASTIELAAVDAETVTGLLRA